MSNGSHRSRRHAFTLVETALAPSKNEARRLIEQGAVTLDGEKAPNPALELPPRAEPYLFKVGKRRFLRVLVS